MATITTAVSPILDSAGQPFNGMLYWRQAQQFEASTGYVTSWPGRTAVRGGHFLYGDPVIPATAPGELAQLQIGLLGWGGGTPITWWTHIDASPSIEFADLPVDVAPEGSPSVPSWATDLIEAIDDLESINDPIVAALVEDDGSDTSVAMAGLYAKRNPGVVHVREHISGSGDKTSAVQALVNSLSNGDELIFDKGTWRIDGTVTFPQDNLTCRLRAGATIDRTNGNAFISTFVFSGDDVDLRGWGKITSPASWDGTNSAWTYAVVHCTGASPKVKQWQLENVPRVGFGFDDCNGDVIVDGVTVVGNFPAGSWTGLNTVHFGIAYDPGVTDARIHVTNKTVVKSCVQGFASGNFGTGSSEGSTVTDSIFQGCHNHAIYESGGNASMLINANIFIDCAQPIAMTGHGHTVSNNKLKATGTGSNIHTVCNIHMRNATGCKVFGNTLEGNLFQGAPAIDFSHVSGGTTITDNDCYGNTIIVTGTNTGIGIRMGATTTTTWRNNSVHHNTLVGGGITNFGAIVLSAANGSPGIGGMATHNRVTLKGAWAGVYADSMLYPDLSHNHVRIEFDAGSPVTIGGVMLQSTVVGAQIDYCTFVCTALWGTNVTFRAIYELSGTTGNRIGPNRYELDLTKLTAGVRHFMQVTSGSILNEALTGAPAVACGPGSTWRRTDGAAGTTLYIKETAASSAVWTRVTGTTSP